MHGNKGGEATGRLRAIKGAWDLYLDSLLVSGETPIQGKDRLFQKLEFEE